MGVSKVAAVIAVMLRLTRLAFTSLNHTPPTPVREKNHYCAHPRNNRKLTHSS